MAKTNKATTTAKRKAPPAATKKTRASVAHEERALPVTSAGRRRAAGETAKLEKTAKTAQTGKTAKTGRTAKAGKAAQPPGDAPPLSPRARPFVKWAGGKRQLLREIVRHVPEEYGTYHEPFLGGGAVFFSLAAGKPARLSDLNERLVRTYRGIKENVEQVISCLAGYSRERSFFERMRERDIDSESDVEVAAWFIFLNKTGFNGLYRVNSQNRFNVPFGSHKKDARFFDGANLRACSAALQSATIEHCDFEEALRAVEPGDFVYLDPPYVPLSLTSNFTSYTAEGFSHEDQERLRDAALELKRRQVHVVLSNSSSSAYLYKHGFETIPVLASRPVNSKGNGRGKIAELLIK